MIFKIFDIILLVGFIGTVPFLVPILLNINYYWDYMKSQFNSDFDQDNPIYDFIVVGSGSSGSVIANRLSKNSKVLLLEAGGDPIYHVSVPFLAQELMNIPHLSYNYKTVPQRFSSQSMTNKQSRWPRGKVLGGTSSLNYMIYIRGNPLDYDNWANITGDPRWNYENVLPYFKKSINYNGKYKDNVKHYGQSAYGYLQVEQHSHAPLHKHFAAGLKELNYDEVDLNGPQRPGVGMLEVTQKGGSRHSTYEAFLKPFLTRQNLKVSRYSTAVKIKFDKQNRAIGVWYIRHGKKRFARASKEIIVSAGVVDSPKLLMLSGIGPKSHLESLNIKSKVDLQVGQNLKDHPAVFLLPITISEPLSLIPLRDLGLKDFTDYFFNGKGIMTCPGVIHSHAFISTKYAVRKDWPDIQLYISSVGLFEPAPSELSRVLGFDLEKITKFYGKFNESDGLLLIITLVKPRSVGEIKLIDNNYETMPLIDPKYFENPIDVKAIVEGIKLSLRLIEETKSFQSLNAKLLEKVFPECQKFKFRSDEYWECYVRNVAISLYHPVGTCRMGKDKNDPKAVVDSELRVLNTKRIRIGDVSVMPEIINGNTNAPAILIGEMVSDFIREHWMKQFEICNKLEYLKDFNYLQKCFYSRLM